MRTVWTFAWKEFLLNLRSARFLVGFLLCLVIIPFTMMVSVDDYKIQTDICRVEMAQAQAKLDSCVVWSSVRPVVVRQPEVLSLFCRGISNNFGYKIQINLETIPVLPDRFYWMLNSPFMKVFPTLDFSGVLGIMISLLTLVFSYDAVTREREEGTLRFIFSSSGSRLAFLVGKWLGVVLTVVPVVAFCFVMALGFATWGAGVSLSPGEWAAVGWMSLSSFVYLSLFAWMGIFISALHVYSVDSVVVCMLCWLGFLFVIPSLTANFSGRSTSPVASGRIEHRKKEINTAFWNDLSHAFDSIRNSLGMDQVSYLVNIGGGNGEKDIRGGSKLVLEHTRRMAAREYELRVEYARRCWELEAGYLEGLIRQQRWQDGLGFLSLSSAFSHLMSGLCYTDASAFQGYMDEVRAYREQYLAFLSDRGIVNSLAYITPMRETDFMEDAEWQVFEKERTRLLKDDPSAYERLIKGSERKYMNRWYKPVDTSELPRFIPAPVSGWRRLAREWPALLYLCLISFGCMGGAVYMFGKYDLR